MTQNSPTSRFAVIFAFGLVYFFWGSTYLAIRYAVETIPPLYAAGIRHLTSGTILLLWCAAKKVRPTMAQIRTGIVIGVLFFLGPSLPLGHHDPLPGDIRSVTFWLAAICVLIGVGSMACRCGKSGSAVLAASTIAALQLFLFPMAVLV